MIKGQSSTRTSDIELLPFSHCDQVFVTSNYTIGDIIHKEDFFTSRYKYLRDWNKAVSINWSFHPPHLSMLPSDSYEYWINQIMWDEKTRIAKMANKVCSIKFFLTFNINSSMDCSHWKRRRM